MPNANQNSEVSARNIFITPGQLVEGTITEVNVNQDPFHCRIKILPKNTALIQAEGRYSDHEISLGKLKRNLVQLKFNIRDIDDIITAVESLEGRQCVFRVDKSGWVSWIPRIIVPIPPPPPVPAPVLAKQALEEVVEIFFIRHQRCIYRMEDLQGDVHGWAVGPTGATTQRAHGWVLGLESRDDAIQVLKNREKTT